jgi:hypothetical protein
MEATLLADLRPALDGWADPIAFGVGYDGAVYVAARRPSTEPLREDGFPKSRLLEPADTLVVRAHGGAIQTVTVPAASVVVSYVQPIPGGILLVGARCHWRAEGPEQNAFVVDWEGNVVRSFTVGDGVQDVRVTAEGHTWVSYFDEGVFGNYGWGNPGPDPIGASGLVELDAEGKVRFTYDPKAARTDWICDAYAVNLADDGALWLYFYSEFPIVRIREHEYRSWSLGVSGGRALAVREGRALLFGDYAERSLGRLIALENDAAHVVEEVRIDDGSGGRLDGARVCGRGERLFFLKDRQVLVVQDW